MLFVSDHYYFFLIERAMIVETTKDRIAVEFSTIFTCGIDRVKIGDSNILTTRQRRLPKREVPVSSPFLHHATRFRSSPKKNPRIFRGWSGGLAKDQQDLIKNPGMLQMFSGRRNMAKRGEAILLLQWDFLGHSGILDGVL